MKKTTSIVVLLAGFVLAGSSPALAQTPAANTVFIDVNGGGQTQSRAINTSASFPIYGETATVNDAQKIASGPIFDISGGYRVWRGLSVGVGFSAFSRTSIGTVIASVPNPIVFNRPLAVTASSGDLKHSELGTHVMAVWFIPVTDEIDVDFFAGPSFIRVQQDVMTASVPPGTQTVNVATTRQTGTARGGNVGISASYLFSRHYGAGLFMRYAGGSVDLPAVSNLKVGGFQIGGGMRLRY